MAEAKINGAPSPHPGNASRLGWLALLPLALFGLALHQLLSDAPPRVLDLAWFPSAGVDLRFLLDGLALQFVLLITGVGAMVMVYAGGYMAGMAQRERLFVLLFLFMLAMLGCVTSDNLVVTFLFWEMTSLTSFLLVGFKHEYTDARKSAQQALMVTFGGGLVLLAGVIMLGNIAGTLTISELIATAPAWRDDPRLGAAIGLLCVGAFTKSAQLPFHFWLPNAMAAPTPVSAYLHSATMVKLGVYLLARLDPAFDDLALWQQILVPVGAATAAWAMLLTLRERDLKRILAWSTVSALGTLVMLVGLPGEAAATAMGTFLLAHALYKAPLFFVAGNVDHCTGSRNIDHVTGLAPRMPWTAAAAALAAISMAGMPFSMGFVAKDLIDIAKEQGGALAWISYSSVFVNAITVAVAAVATIRVFFRRRGEEGVPGEIHEAHWTMLLPPLLIGSLGITLGLLPWLLDPLIGGTVSSTGPGGVFEGIEPAVTHFHAWTAIAIAAALGAVVFVFWDRLHRLIEQVLLRADPLSSIAWYRRMMAAIPALATALTPRLQNGRLTTAVLLILVSLLVLTIGALWLGGAVVVPDMGTPSLTVAGASLAMIAAAVGVCLVRDPFLMLLVSGFIGLSSALLFLFLAAPDLAFTQFAVEVAFVVVIAAVLLRMRRLGAGVGGDAPVLPRLLIAVAASVTMMLVLLGALDGPFDTALPDYFAQASYPEAHGRNVVNVILVDFRAVDTLGEISVVAIALLGLLPLLALLRRRQAGRTVTGRPGAHP
ncbi:hydrogen gas-evolving membrane-bound hydrogenase subunit E [Luteimonas abyssi]|uniref:hydrogen gas-evolving membrane-bound hydrogenase subunit E n=1 Tax=Luteimonas abyssi TaxID=1247514 RepID=UPI000737AFE4|nr:hydrogen gas-evolving membrane-bound hydrogenase subunit E [Luteimonas abyssi]